MQNKKRVPMTFPFLFAGCLFLFAAIFLGRSIYENAMDSLGAVSFQKGTIAILSNGTQHAGAEGGGGTAPGIASESDGMNQPEYIGIAPEDIKTLQKELKTNIICYSGSLDSRVFSGSNSAKAVITGTTELAPMFGDIRIRKGSFFSEADNREGSRVAVIEDKLAWNLFHNEDVLGCDIEISGATFQIIGVAGSDRSIFGKPSDDEPLQVYIPAGTFTELAPDAVISYFQYRTASGGTNAGNAGDMTRAVSSAGWDQGSYLVSDFNIRGAVMRQKTDIPVFLMGGLLLLILWSLVFQQSGRIFRSIRSECQTDYFFRAVHTLRFEIGKNLLLILFAAASSYAVWRMIRFTLYIPPELIPDDFTDLSYYTRMLWRKISQSLLYTGSEGTLGSFPELRISAMETLQSWIVYGGCLAGSLFFLTGLILAGKEKIPADRRTVACGIFLAADAGILLLLSYAAGLPLRMDAKGLAVFWGFLFVSLMKSSAEKQVQSVEIDQFYESEEQRYV